MKFKPTRFLLALTALLAVSLLTAETNQSVSTDSISDLACSPQPGNALFFTGSYHGQPVQMVRRGAMGVGTWDIYTGPPTGRVRLSFVDKKGLREILSMDRGQRITVNPVAQERIEYRLYAPDRSFLIGSVIYRKNDRWLQGLMKTEAFVSYADLIETTDVTSKMMAQSSGRTKTASLWLRTSPGFSLISTASAEDLDTHISNFFSPSAEEARDFFGGAPGDQMVIGSMAGAAAFTVKLLATDPLILGPAVAVAAPLLTSVVIGVGVGLMADRVRTWADSKNLSGTSSLHDLYDRLVAPTLYSKQPSEPAPTALTIASPLPLKKNNFLAMAEQLDKLDHLDFMTALDHAASFTQSRDYVGAQAELDRAQKLARGAQDKSALQEGRQGLADALARAEQMRKDEELRQLAIEQQHQRDLQAAADAQAEQERRDAQVRRDAENEETTTSYNSPAPSPFQGLEDINNIMRDGQARIAAARSARAGSRTTESVARAPQADTTYSSSMNQTPSSRYSASTDTTQSPRAVTAAPPAASWHDDLTTTEVESGKVTTFPGHSESISGETIATSMSSRADAQSLWGSQGGIVTSYSGCGACGVGATITVVVKFSSVIDSHVYKRDR